jgi:CheY-like chemotaxis protein
VLVSVEAIAGDAGQLQLRFSVRDTGIGIPLDKQEHVFQAFAQADGSTTRKYGGTGLGLAISAHLVELMAGRLWLESAPGAGSTVCFTAQLGRAQAQPTRDQRHLPVDLEGLPVLVVDDNGTNRLILEETLRRRRMTPELAPSGAEALEMLSRAAQRGHPFPLILLDGHMPEMDGVTLAERIRRDPRLTGAMIMMLTSGTQPEDRERCQALGIQVSVTKPVRPSHLPDAIVTVLAPRLLGGTEPVPAAPKPPVAAPGSGLKVLVAEDNQTNQLVARRHLGRMGHRVTVVENGRLALELTAREPFDAVLMDVQMPEMGSFEATTAIRERVAKSGDRDAAAAGMAVVTTRLPQVFTALDALQPR